MKRTLIIVTTIVLLAVAIAFAQWPSNGPSGLPGAKSDSSGGMNVGGNINATSVNAKLVKTPLGTAIPSATTIVPVTALFHVTGTTAIVTITPPALTGPTTGTFTGCIQIIPDGIFTTTAAGNIANATTAVVGKLLTECYDGTKWYSSY